MDCELDYAHRPESLLAQVLQALLGVSFQCGSPSGAAMMFTIGGRMAVAPVTGCLTWRQLTKRASNSAEEPVEMADVTC